MGEPDRLGPGNSLVKFELWILNSRQFSRSWAFRAVRVNVGEHQTPCSGMQITGSLRREGLG